MSGRTKLRPPTLSSTISKGLLESKNVAEFEHLFGTLDKVGAIFDGLVEVRTAVDPMISREAAAIKYRNQHASAVKAASDYITKSYQRILDRAGRLEKDALGRAGISHVPPEASEIRAALRSMSDRDRNKTIADAIANGDTAVIASLRNVSPMLIGHTTVPVRELIQMHVNKVVPGLEAELADCETALYNLDLARQTFEKEAEKMRDLKAEQDAEDGVQKAKLADAKLGLAVQQDGSVA